MSIQAVLLPLFVEVLLTFVLLFWMAHLRTRAFRIGEVKARDVALCEPNWPPQIWPGSSSHRGSFTPTFM